MSDWPVIGVATADLYPRISLGGTALGSDSENGGSSFGFSLGPLISWSFPNMAVARAKARQARAQADISLANFDGKVLTALKEVEQALTRVDTEQRRRDALRDAKDRSERAWQLAEARYKAGSISYLDALVAQSDMLRARADYAASQQVLASNRIDLFKALGGGWQDAAGPAAP
ncbi:TolC family protein [Novosphingobium sp. ZN18A2]|uniref:TolC family protein n=1 Tax=Novosphingobium sp. ZN18A2 TaxID=3079861 RepID=UPI0030CB916B